MLGLNKAYQLIIDKIEGWVETFIAMLPNLILCFALLILFWFISKLIRKGTLKLLKKLSDNIALNKLAGTVIFFIIMSLGIFIALSVLKLDKAVTSLLAGAGVIGLALGFAFQDTATNFISGIFMAVRKPFKIGDVITTKDQMGVVQKMNLRNIIINSFQGQEVIIPNKDVFQNKITNYTSTGIRRIDIEVGIAYTDDLEKVRSVAVNAIKELDFLLEDKEVDFYYLQFGSSSINFTVNFWIDYPDQMGFLTAQSEGIIAIKKAFDKNNITIPFPIRTLDINTEQIKPLFYCTGIRMK